jgi:UDP-N-acetylglucosamine 1-carboxyvinyltransferase
MGATPGVELRPLQGALWIESQREETMEGSSQKNVLIIEGGRRLTGDVAVKGSKNASLAILSGVLACRGPVFLRGLPDVSDIRIKLGLMEQLGAKVEFFNDGASIDCSELHQADIEPELARKIRTSFNLLGPLMARLGSAKLPQPGGCPIGTRPVDFHIKGLTALGAKVDLRNGIYIAKGPKLQGCAIYLDFPSAGATQHIMATAVLASGSTVIQNAAIEPEIIHLADFLNRMGAKVEGAGSSTITIEGVQALEGGEFNVPADRLQAGTYLIAAAATGGEIKVCGILPEYQSPVVSKLKEMGAEVEQGPDWIQLKAGEYLAATTVKTMPYPGFPTDMQQPMAALLTMANGVSIVEETIYENRTQHVPELRRMGAIIHQDGRTCVITGVERLDAAVVTAPDLRGGAALVVAGLAARGKTVVKGVEWIDRGYEDFEQTLNALGANVQRVPAEEWEAAS